MITPNMTARGKQIAFLLAVLFAFAIPKHVVCGYPTADKCTHKASFGRTCTPYELEPFGFYLIERLAGRDVGFAYSSGEDCK